MKDNSKIILSKEGKISVDKIVNFLSKKCNIKLVPVKGQYDAYWLSGKDGYDMIDGNKYYKLILSGYGIEIVCQGGWISYSMQGSLVDWMKEGFEYDREIA